MYGDDFPTLYTALTAYRMESEDEFERRLDKEYDRIKSQNEFDLRQYEVLKKRLDK